MISQKIIDRTTVLLNPGTVLDNNNAHEMVNAITEVQGNGYTNIIIDMNSLEFLSSAGIGSILGTVETSRECGGDIILQNPSDKILHILDVLDLTEYMTIKSGIEGVKAQ